MPPIQPLQWLEKTKVPKIGKCALCHREGQELQDSHYLPAGVYRVVRNENVEDGNPNPILFHSEAVVQTSKQITDYLLCHDCELRLSRNGEDYFLKYCWRRNGFRLHAILDAASPSIVSGSIKVYSADKFPEIDIRALTYFGASMFWRDSVHHWKSKNYTSEQIQLGPYEEQFRTYLLGESDFPEHCVLWISVPENITPLTALSLTPYGGSNFNGVRLYKLVVLGVGFLLYVGRALTAEHRELCSVRGKGHPIYKTDLLEQGITKDLFQLFSLNPHLAAGPK
jgi:hypothetical protein